MIGVGGPLGDDAVGLHVARRLAAAPLPEGVRVLARERAGIDLALDLREAEVAVIVDALRAGGRPGQVRRLPPAALARSAATSTHGLGVADALALAEALGTGPARVGIVGVEIGTLRAETLSPPVAAAVEPACAEVRALLAELGVAPAPGPAPAAETPRA